MICNKCGMHNDDSATYCSNCGAQLSGYEPAVDAQAPTPDVGADAEYYEAALGFKNTAYYLPIFARFDAEGVSASWNWPAFFASFYWLLYRKMWGYALAYFFLPVPLFMISGGLAAMVELGALIGGVIHLGVLFVLFPMYANGLYYRHIKRKIAENKGTHADRERGLLLLAAKGGVANVAIIILILFVPTVGILAAIAIPAYQDYTIRSQISEGLSLAVPAKVAVAEYFLNTGMPPADRAMVHMSPDAEDTVGKYVSAVGIKDGVIFIVYGNDAHSQITGEHLTLTPYESTDLSVVWRCGNAIAPAGTRLLGTAGGAPIAYWAPTVPNQYLPSACRP